MFLICDLIVLNTTANDPFQHQVVVGQRFPGFKDVEYFHVFKFNHA